MYSCVRKYWRWYKGGNPRYNATYYDVNGTEIDSPEVGGSGVYYFEAVKLLSQESASAIDIILTTSTATVTADLPRDVQLSSTPLGGQFHVECIDYEGYYSTTGNFDTWRGTWNLNHQLNYYCDGLIDQVKVVDTSG